MSKRIYYLFLFAVLAVSCDAGLTGTATENQPPSTSFTVNSINLPEGQRLTSQINISWWGDDPDGYVVGYEFYIGDDVSADVEWVFTSKTDSTFVLPIEEGNLDADVRFTVRAVDNEGAVDPDPPSLVFPIRNSPPSVRFLATEIPPDTTYRVFSFGFRATDPDGEANLNRVEFAINDTTSADAWTVLDPSIQLLTFRIDDTQPGNPTEMFTGRGATRTNTVLNTIRTDGDNTFFLRAIDNAGAVSSIQQFSWYVKRQQSNILVLNDFPLSDRINLHLDLLAQIGIDNVDLMNITDGNASGGRRVVLSSQFPNRALVVPTTNMMLAEWDHIYWLSNDLDRNISYAIEMTIDFFANGGTMFVNIPTKNDVPADSPVFEFLPFDRIQSPPAARRFFIANNSELTATEDAVNLINSGQTSITEVPYLRFTRNQVSNLFPVVPFGETIQLFEANFQVQTLFPVTTSPYEGPKGIASVSPTNSVLYFGVDLNEFDQNERVVGDETLPASDLAGLLRLLVLDILNFEQR
ncbi:MAG: hypothetical protein JJU41_01490 [Bacteroidetes bacterium]|nr:hypothetical protein [Bacteroidota bacterium]MCH8522927.1 hypothetical protein [Balneolales bacterium]